MRELRQEGLGWERFKVAIVGAGQLGTLLATRLPANCRKVIISRQKSDAVQLADEVGGVAADQYSAVRGCRVVFLAIPGSAIVSTIPEMATHLDADAVLVNMAAEVMTDQLTELFPRVRFAAAKIIGHAREMSQGSPGVVVLDHAAGDDQELLRRLLEGLGHVAVDKESKVMAVHDAVADVMVRAESDLREALARIGLDRRIAQAAITTAGAGVLRSLSEGEIEPFVRSALERMRTATGDQPELSH